MSTIVSYKVGQVVPHEEVCKNYKIGCMGGIRYSKENNVVVLFHLANQSYYSDYWDGDVFYYVGMGKGDQSELYLSNRRITESENKGTSIHLFERIIDEKCEYIGEMRLSGKPVYRKAKDKKGVEFTQVLFPLKKK